MSRRAMHAIEHCAWVDHRRLSHTNGAMRGTDLACIPPARKQVTSVDKGQNAGGQQRAALRDRAGAAMTHIGLRAHAAGCPDPPCIAADLHAF